MREFHVKFGQPFAETPALPAFEVAHLRAKLIREESRETTEAIWNGDIGETADGLADLIYVAIGTALAYGIDLEPIWDAVHASNMAKEGGGTREDGKIMKPLGWKPPAIRELLEAQCNKT